MKEKISIIYHQENDIPKYIEINKSKIYFYTILLPILTILSISLGVWSFVHNNPVLIWNRYQEINNAQTGISNNDNLKDELLKIQNENIKLNTELQKALSPETQTEESAKQIPLSVPGISNLSYFKSIPNQRDLTHQKLLNLSGFSTSIAKNKLTFNFNIIPTNTDEKTSGFIIVLSKFDNFIHTYPEQITNNSEFLADYTLGESFSTQRFRPVEATFKFPDKSGDFPFKIFIFSKTGDLLHVQQMTLKVKI